MIEIWYESKDSGSSQHVLFYSDAFIARQTQTLILSSTTDLHGAITCLMCYGTSRCNSVFFSFPQSDRFSRTMVANMGQFRLILKPVPTGEIQYRTVSQANATLNIIYKRGRGLCRCNTRCDTNLNYRNTKTRIYETF